MASRAGPLALPLALPRGKQQHIHCGEHETWHRVAFVLRDTGWGTPPNRSSSRSSFGRRSTASASRSKVTGFWAAARLRLPACAIGSLTPL